MTFLSVNAQESRFKDFVENHKTKSYCLYPSTIRMLNIGNNKEFDELVTGVKKLLIYKLDSISIADKLYNNMLDDFKSVNFEEIISMSGGGNTTNVLLSPEEADSEIVGVFISDDVSVAFFMEGEIALEKIPGIITNFNNEDFINIIDFKF